MDKQTIGKAEALKTAYAQSSLGGWRHDRFEQKLNELGYIIRPKRNIQCKKKVR